MRYQQFSSAVLTLVSIASAAPSPYGGHYYHNGYNQKAAEGNANEGQVPSQPWTSSMSSAPAASTPLTGGSTSGGSTPGDSTSGGSTPSDDTSDGTTTSGNTSGASVSTKKGAGVWGGDSGLGSEVTKVGASWAYDWSDNPENSFGGSVPSGVDLVAMINTASDLTSLKSSSYKEIIGYNEPDGTAASVDSSTAANNWPAVVATGKRIGSPAPANTKLAQGDWFYDFMSSIAQQGSHVDFICLHHYSPDGDVSEFQSYIESVYNMYKLPIWVTEWAQIDYSQNPPTVPDDETQVKYMQAAASMMDGLSYVERYAWFALPQSSAQPATNLFDSSGNITPMGTAYAAL